MALYLLRGGLAQVIHERMQNDEWLSNMDKHEWYEVRQDEIEKAVFGRLHSDSDTCPNDGWSRATTASNSNAVWPKFEQFHLDKDSEDFLQACIEQSDNICWQIWLSIATTFLRWFMTQTSLNGFLRRGSMQVFSSAQFKKLIDYDGMMLNSLLDIGAGDGFTTVKMADCFHDVYVTEMSKPMKSTLKSKGFFVLNENSWANTDLQFDVITCLNVLDRCDKPLDLLKQIKSRLNPNGIAVIAFVIPFSPYVEFKSPTKKPEQTLPISGNNFESEIVNFIQNVLEPNGWDLIKWTRVPYLCQGDIKQAYYWLHDAVFVVRPTK